MVTALCFISTEPRAINSVGEQVAALKNVRAVYSLTGEVDMVAIIEVPDLDAVPAVVTDRIASINGVTATQTHIAFRTYSREDVEEGFSIGLGD